MRSIVLLFTAARAWKNTLPPRCAAFVLLMAAPASGGAAASNTRGAVEPSAATVADYALVMLPAELSPIGLAADGTVVLHNGAREGVVAYRWKRGVLQPLRLPDGMRAQLPGAIAGAGGCVALTNRWVWPAGAETAVALRAPVFPLARRDALTGAEITAPAGVALVFHADAQNRLWGRIVRDVRPDAGGDALKLSSARWDSPVAEPVQLNYEVLGVSSIGTVIAATAATGGRRQFAVGPGSAADFGQLTRLPFRPRAVNEHGWVLGIYENSGGRRFVLWKDGRERALPAGEFDGLDARNNLLGTTPDGRRALWTQDPIARASDPADLTRAFEPIFHVRVALPAGWTADHQVVPGDDELHLGAGAYRDPARAGAEAESRPFLLVPAGLRVDADGDGAINPSRLPGNADRHPAEQGRPFAFSFAAGGGRREAADLQPVYLDLRRLLDVLPPADGFGYRLRQADGAVDFFYTDLRPATAGAHRRDPARAADYARAGAIPVTATGAALTGEFLERIKTHGQGVLLLAGRAPTKRPLCLEVWRRDERLAVLELPLDVTRR